MTVHEPEAGGIQATRDRIRAMQDAMTWLLRIRDGSLSEQDLAEWTLWYESDERNRRAFDELQRFWLGSGALAAGTAGGERIRALLEEGASRPQTPSARSAGKWLLWPAATAASAALLIFLIHAAAPRLFGSAPPAPVAPPLVRETLLPDGSQVELAPKSILQVHYTPAERRVALRTGEAYFSVIHDPARPFVLSVNGLLIRDVGTVFNIRDGDGHTEVTVVKGAIDVIATSARGPGCRAAGASLPHSPGRR